MQFQDLLSYLTPITLFKTNSDIHGEIKVVKINAKISIFTGNVFQSGPSYEKLGEEIAKQLMLSGVETNKILAFGLGGGSITKILNKYFPLSKITVVEIDKKIIEIYKKYFQEKKIQDIEIINVNANKFVEEKNNNKVTDYYNTIIVDLFEGENIPKFVFENNFLSLLRQLLINDGIVIFNRIKDQNKNFEADNFLDKLREIYHDIYVKEVRLSQKAHNLLIFCRK